MPEQTWIETKKECDVNEKGELVPKKITLEASQPAAKILGINTRDFADWIFKIAGLITIIIAVLQFKQDINKSQADTYFRRQEDSAANAKNAHDAKIADSELHLQQIAYIKSLAKDAQEEHDAQTRLQQGMQQQLDALREQANIDLEKQNELYTLDVMTSLNTVLQSLLYNAPGSDAYKKSQYTLETDILARLMRLDNTDITDKVNEIILCANMYQCTNAAYIAADTIYEVYNFTIEPYFNKNPMPAELDELVARKPQFDAMKQTLQKLSVSYASYLGNIINYLNNNTTGLKRSTYWLNSLHSTYNLMVDSIDQSFSNSANYLNGLLLDLNYTRAVKKDEHKQTLEYKLSFKNDSTSYNALRSASFHQSVANQQKQIFKLYFVTESYKTTLDTLSRSCTPLILNYYKSHKIAR